MSVDNPTSTKRKPPQYWINSRCGTTEYCEFCFEERIGCNFAYWYQDEVDEE